MLKLIMRAWGWLILFIIFGCSSEVGQGDTSPVDAGGSVVLQRNWSLYWRECTRLLDTPGSVCPEWQVTSITDTSTAVQLVQLGQWCVESLGVAREDTFDELELWARHEFGPSNATVTASLRCAQQDAQVGMTLMSGMDQSSGPYYELTLLCAVTEVAP